MINVKDAQCKHYIDSGHAGNIIELGEHRVNLYMLKRHDQFVAFYFYCKFMLISISYNYCSVLTTNKCFIETELTS